ncbi:MAG TPA: DUF1707 domain-containing protein [Micromonosporaceae bacterium]|nr:DUF1707 domain-containing protein [Micromonosporaceae bacterium]
MSGELVPDQNLLMGDADRERVVARLHVALSEGRITLSEFEERVAGVLAARTFGAVVPYLEGLPQAPVGPSPAVRTQLNVRGSSLRRQGRWVVPSTLSVEATGSGVRLDFTEAVIYTSVVEIDLRLRGSSATLTVPVGSSVDVGGVSLTGSSAKTRGVTNHQAGTGTHFVVVGEARGSSIKARTPRQWLWPWERRRRRRAAQPR